MSKTDYGTTDVEISNKTYTLKFTLKAVRGIERHFGGIQGAMQELFKVNLSSLALIIALAAGLDYKRKDLEALEEAIFDEGLAQVNPQVIKYISKLLNPSAKSDEELEEAEASGNE